MILADDSDFGEPYVMSDQAKISLPPHLFPPPSNSSIYKAFNKNNIPKISLNDATFTAATKAD
jgi:hypothetical protein